MPVLSVSLVSRAGSESNPVGKGGLASLTADGMGEATKSLDHTHLANAQELIGTSINVSSSMDGVSSTMTVLTDHTQQGMDLFSGVVLHPAFNPADLERIRQQHLVGIDQEGDSVSALARRVGPLLVYGDHPYGAAPTGTTQSVKALTPADVQAFYTSHFGPADSALVLVGDVTLPEARTLATQYFGQWTGQASPAVPIPPAPKLQPTHIVIIDKPGAPQTALFAYGLGISADSPDLPIIQMMNFTLGSGFASRINMNLREVHGYTYGARSTYTTYRSGGPFLAGGLVRTDVTGAAARELMYEIKRFPSTPPTQDELRMARDSRIQSLPGQFESTAATASSIASLFLYSRPLNYYAGLPASYLAVTPADIARISSEDIHADNLIIVAAGDRTKIEPQLKDANLGPIEIRDAQGNLIPKAK